MPRIYRMHRTTAREIGDDANLLWELPPLPGRVFSVDITPRRPASSPPAAASTATATSTSIAWSPRRRFPTRFKRFSTSRSSQRSAEETAQLQKHFEQGVQTLAKVEVAEGGVYAVALSPSGDRVAAAGGDGTVRLIDTQNGSLVASFVPVEISKADGRGRLRRKRAEPRIRRRVAPLGERAAAARR